MVLDAESRDGQSYVGRDERWHKGTVSPHGNREGDSPTVIVWHCRAL